MRKYNILLKFSLTAFVVAAFAISCSDEFLDRPPQGTYSGPSLANKDGVEGVLIGAYSTLNGRPGNWYGGATNWLWGSVSSDEAYKGSEESDQADANAVEKFEVDPGNPLLRNKWNATFDGIMLANRTLQVLESVEEISEEDRDRITSEARFIRGHHHFEGMKMFYRIPYVSEEVEDFTTLSNAEPIWPEIEADFRYGYENLPDVMPNVGRINKWAAAAYLAKAMIYQGKFSEALPILKDVIENGTTSTGEALGLNESFHDNFRIATQNNKEVLFAIQSSVYDGAVGLNGNYENVLNYPHNAGSPGGCCGFFQPSQWLVDSYRTDENGLPFLDNFYEESVTSDEAVLSKDAFTPYEGTLDPRLDWTVGRRGIPYLDWGVHPGRNWIRQVTWGGPYSPKKNVFYKEEEGTLHQPGSWGQVTSALNFPVIRFADVILWAAEAEAEAGSLAEALRYVNMVRERADNVVVTTEDGEPAANYLVEPYASFSGKDHALKAIRFERKLELAMEGHRRFDLVRWGLAAEVINDYLEFSCEQIDHLCDANFEAGKDEYFPIPGEYVDRSRVDGNPTITQPYVN